MLIGIGQLFEIRPRSA